MQHTPPPRPSLVTVGALALAFAWLPARAAEAQSVNLCVEDMSDEEIISHRTAQVHFREEWRYVGGKRTKVRHYEAGNPSRFTFVQKRFKAHGNDQRFHELNVYSGGLTEEVYFGLEVDDHPEELLKNRFKDIVTRLKLLKP